jgi:PII-like signaling protein
MKIENDANLLRIFLGESDKSGLATVYEKIVVEAKKEGLAGATVLKGVMGFGSTSRIHSSKILRLSEDLPIVIEIVDELDKIESFILLVEEIFEECGCGGLITIEKARIIRYKPSK